MNQLNPNPQPPTNIDLQIQEAFVESVAQERLLAAVAATLVHQGRPEAELSVIVADDELLRGLNRDYAGIDATTDVLSFSALETAAGQPASFVSAPEAEPYLGDVIISCQTAARQAAAAGHPLSDELCLLAIHGTLHLLGYDHATAEEKSAMWAVQAQILGQLNIQIDADRDQ